jgi:hypothetical protein
MKKFQINSISAVLTLLLAVLFFAACQKAGAGYEQSAVGKASVKIYLTDDPSLVFDAVNIDIQKMEIKVEDSLEEQHEMEHQSEADDDDQNGHTAGGWMPVTIHPGVYNVLNFRNGLDTLFASADFASNRTVRKIRLTLGNQNSVVLNGATLPLSVKGKDNIIVIKLHELEISSAANSVTNFWLDFDAGRSIRMHGNNLELKPEVKAFRKEKAGSIEGRVVPAEANAIVYAMMGADTVASAKPEREGEFKIVGLKAGSYTLLIDATANNYTDKTITGISVQAKEDAQVGTITLNK